jgi:hypothetical protein
LNVYLLSQEEDDEKACDLLDEALQHGVCVGILLPWTVVLFLNRFIRVKDVLSYGRKISNYLKRIVHSVSLKFCTLAMKQVLKGYLLSTGEARMLKIFRHSCRIVSHFHKVPKFMEYGPFTDEVIAKNELKELFQRFVNDSRLSTRNMVISGASQGGKLAIEQLLAGQIFKARGFIAVIPAIIPHTIETIKRLLQNNNWKQMKGCIITGTRDPFYEETMKLKPLFEQYQFPCLWLVMEGLFLKISKN